MAQDAASRYFRAEPRIGHGSRWADIFDVIADMQTAQREFKSRKESELLGRIALMQTLGIPMEDWPDEIIGGAAETFGLFERPGKTTEIPRAPKKERVEKRRIEEREILEPTAPTPAARGKEVVFAPGYGLSEKVEVPFIEETMVEQPPLEVPTTQERVIGGKTYHVPIKEPTASLNIGQLAETLGYSLPSGMNPSVPVAAIRQLGLEPVSLLEAPPTRQQSQERIDNAYTNLVNAMASRNPQQAAMVWRQYEDAVRQGQVLHGSELVRAPLDISQGVLGFTDMWRSGWDSEYHTPLESLTAQATLEKAWTENILTWAQWDPTRALSIAESLNNRVVSSDAGVLAGMPLYDIDDRTKPVMEADGVTPKLDDEGKPITETVPGLRTILNEIYQDSRLGRQLDLSYRIAQVANAQRLAAGGGGGRRGGGGDRSAPDTQTGAGWGKMGTRIAMELGSARDAVERAKAALDKAASTHQQMWLRPMSADELAASPEYQRYMAELGNLDQITRYLWTLPETGQSERNLINTIRGSDLGPLRGAVEQAREDIVLETPGEPGTETIEDFLARVSK